MVPAVDDSGLATSGQNYFCTVPMFERAERITFEFRAQVNTNEILSIFDNFYLREYASLSCTFGFHCTTCTTLLHYYIYYSVTKP